MKPLLFKCDFIGFTPQFRILDEVRYKSVFSSLLSILIILFSVIFVSISFIDFIHQKPEVEYYKSNDDKTNKTFVISDSLIMYRTLFYCFSEYSQKAKVYIRLYSKEGIDKEINSEQCLLGENINLRYKDLIDKFNSIEASDIHFYLCINYNNTNFTLYSQPFTFNVERELVIKIYTECEDYYLKFELITQNDLIDHNKKDNPIIPYYKRNLYELRNGKKRFLNYNYQYIKYESDDGIFFSNKKILNGIGDAGADEFDYSGDRKNIFSISFKINDGNYDYYKRTFKKFQSFLAEVTSLINILITISKIISEFLLYKKMNKDIIRYILNSKEKKENVRKKVIFFKDKLFKQIYENDDKSKNNLVEKSIKENKIHDKEKSNASFNISNKDNTDNIFKVESIDNTIIINEMKNLNLLNVIKSFFCFKGKKMKLINLCNDIVQKDICVEKILKRLYSLENNFNLLFEKNNNKTDLSDDLSGVKKIITEIRNQKSNPG